MYSLLTASITVAARVSKYATSKLITLSNNSYAGMQNTDVKVHNITTDTVEGMCILFPACYMPV